MSIDNPFNGFKTIKEYAKRNNARAAYVTKAVQLSRKYFQTSQSWVRNSPLERLKLNNINHSGTDFYISAVTNDEFGFNEGDILLANALYNQGAKVQWEFLNGNHCDINQESLANFFLDL